MGKKEKMSIDEILLKFKEYNLEVLDVQDNISQLSYVYVKDKNGYIHRTNYISLNVKHGRKNISITHPKNIYSFDNIKLFLHIHKRPLIPISYNRENRQIELRCTKCSYEFISDWKDIKMGCNCPRCANIITDDTNSVFALRYDLVKYFKNEDDSKNIRVQSNKKVVLKCPYCGHEKIMTMSVFSNNGFACPHCSDGVSFPEKVIYNVLKRLNINFETQKEFTWSGGKLYDFYIPSLNTIIETHGEQHYKHVKLFSTTLEDCISNDVFKKNIAIENKINNYIVLNFSKNNYEVLKIEILNNMKEFSITETVLKESIKDASTSRVVKCWELYNSGIKDTFEISKNIGIARTTVINYLTRGNDVGAVEYDASKNIGKYDRDKNGLLFEKMLRIAKQWESGMTVREIHLVEGLSVVSICSYLRKAKSKGYCNYDNTRDLCNTPIIKIKVLQYDMNMLLLSTFDSIEDAARILNVKIEYIHKRCALLYEPKSTDVNMFRYENAQS